MFDRFKTKIKNYTAIFLQTVGDRYEKIGSQKFNIEDKLIRFKDKQFIIDSKVLGFIDKTQTNVFFDFEQNKQLSFKEIKSSYNAKLIDQLLTGKIIGQLVSRLSALQKQSYFIIIIVGVSCVMIGFVVGQYFAPAHTVVQYLNQTSPHV